MSQYREVDIVNTRNSQIGEQKKGGEDGGKGDASLIL